MVRRDAVSHKDLFVILILIAILLSLALPFVVDQRVGARSNTCKNNMAQLALGMRGFETDFQRFPGYSNGIGNQVVPWGVAVLPQLDRPDVYDTWNSGLKQAPYLQIFNCPDNPPKNSPDKKETAPTSMVYNAGHHSTAADKETKAHGVGLNYAVDGKYSNLESMVDGAHTVLLISENLAATSWADTTNLKQNTVFCWYDSDKPVDHKINGLYNYSINADRVRPSSYHWGGVNVAFADRHTQFLRQDIDYTVYQHLMTPDSAKAGLAGKLSSASYE